MGSSIRKADLDLSVPVELPMDQSPSRSPIRGRCSTVLGTCALPIVRGTWTMRKHVPRHQNGPGSNDTLKDCSPLQTSGEPELNQQETIPRSQR